MKAIRTTSRLGIDQCCLQVVFAKKPAECAHCSDRPLFAAIRAPRGKARGNRRGRLDRLLIERFGIADESCRSFSSQPA